MTRKMLTTNASHDAVTEYLATWSDKLMSLAKTHPDIEIFELRKGRANRKQFEETIKEHAPRLVVIHGHGAEDHVCGYMLEVLVKSDENPDILNGKIVHALSCQSAKRLAPKCIEVGALTYVGYKEDFQLVHLNKTTSEEQSADNIAALFMDPAFEIVIALIEGKTVDTAFKQSQAMYQKNIMSLLAHQDQAGMLPRITSLLYHNFIHQTYMGEGAAVF